MKITIGDYILLRLKELKIEHIFGVAGDYNLGFLDQIIQSEITWIGTCNELNAAYAADGYARVKGAGALVTTFGVGELSAMNGIAGAYAEHVPVVHIVGHPATRYEKNNLLMHHTLGDGRYDVFTKMAENISVYTTILTKANAATEIDRALITCWRQKKPVYIGLPTDLSYAEIDAPNDPLTLTFTSHPENLKQFLEQAVVCISKANTPLLIIDLYAHRYGLKNHILKFLEKTTIPFVTLPMGKAIIDESHPQFLGMYSGETSDPQIKERVEKADCIITLGMLLSDANSGGFSITPQPSTLIEISSDHSCINSKIIPDIDVYTVLDRLSEQLTTHIKQTMTHEQMEQRKTNTTGTITQKKFWNAISTFLPKDSIVIAETGTSLFGTINIPMPDGTTFISQILWGSIGYAVGSLLGASIAAPNRPAILFVGDGAFQLSCQEISTILRYQLTPTIFLLDNDGYTVERLIRGAKMPYNDIQHWHYKNFPFIFDTNVWAEEANTMEALTHILEERVQHTTQMAFIVVMMDKMDSPDEFLKLLKLSKFDPYQVLEV